MTGFARVRHPLGDGELVVSAKSVNHRSLDLVIQVPPALEQVYGALSYYLAHRESVDEYLNEGKEEFARLREESRHKNPSLYARLAEARQKTQRPGA